MIPLNEKDEIKIKIAMIEYAHTSSHTNVKYITGKLISTVTFLVEVIVKTIKNLDSNKAHGHDNIRINIIKICGDTICQPLGIIFSLL